MSTQHTRFDVAEYLVDDETIAAYLDACLEEGGVTLFQKAVGEVARARGMGEVASASGVTRASLYKSLTEEGNPALGTMNRVIESFGLRFSVQPLTETGEQEAQRRVVFRTQERASAQVHRSSTGTHSNLIFARASAGSTNADSRGTSMAAKKKSSSGSVTARSSKSGEFVTKSFAKKNPATTVVEHNRKPAKKGK